MNQRRRICKEKLRLFRQERQQERQRLLVEVMKGRRADLVEHHRPTELTDEQRWAIHDALMDEFLSTGLRDDYEPNARGDALEDLADWYRPV